MKKELIIEKIDIDYEDDNLKIIKQYNGKNYINLKKLNALIDDKCGYYKDIFIYDYFDIVYGERYETDEEVDKRLKNNEENEKRKYIRDINKKLKNKSLKEIQEIQIK